MAQAFRKGDKVEWKSHGGTAVGTVERKITRGPRPADGPSMPPQRNRSIWSVAT